MLRSAIIPILALLCLINTPSLACDLVYEVRNDGGVSELCVTIEKNTDGTTYRSTYRNVTQLYHYNTDNTLTRWEYADRGANTDFKAGRNAGEILIRGTSNGQPLNKSLAAGNQIWLQNSEFGLLEFLKSQEKSKEFIVVAPEDLSVKKVQATRSTAEVVWNDQKINVVMLTARLRGFMSLFWQATYWYRLPEMTFLRYKSDGLPGVPKVDIQLVREKAAQ